MNCNHILEVSLTPPRFTIIEFLRKKCFKLKLFYVRKISLSLNKMAVRINVSGSPNWIQALLRHRLVVHKLNIKWNFLQISAFGLVLG